MNDHDRLRGWDQAAGLTRFAFYEVVEPAPSLRWAGGYGGDANEVVQIEVLAEVEGVEVSVRTLGPSEVRTLEDHLRGIVTEALWYAVMSRSGFFSLPLSIDVMPVDRTLVVDRDPVSFTGFNISGVDGWSGVAAVGGCVVVVKIAGEISDPSLGICARTSLPQTPRGH